MSDVNIEESKVSFQKLLVTSESFGTMVPVSHSELDGLVGQLMQICDLMGDPVQRKALKDTIKRICRDWLDTEYKYAGYDKFAGIQEGATQVHLEGVKQLVALDKNLATE